MSEMIYKEYDQCPICGDPLKKNKKSDGLLCGCCGFNITQKTKVSDEDKERLLQANEALRSYEFDRAEARYNLIIEDNLNNEEIYIAGLFGKLLSQFGVVYIKDTNGEMIPTFAEYNPSVASIMDSSVYKTLVSAKIDESIKTSYIEKVKALDNIYQRIDKELKDNSEYDLFICTKISKKTLLNPNERGYTEDSRIADDFYQELRHKGIKVFYSDRCCNQVEYDSQILSALLKSKRILIIAIEKEYLESAWVQSEWRRWLNFIDCGVKSKDSMILYFPYYEKEPFELPRPLRKVQRYSRLLQVVSMFEDLPKEEKKEEKSNKVNAEEVYNLAMKYYRGEGVEKSYTEAVKHLKEAVKLGHAKSQYTLGYCYFNGLGVDKSHQEAFKLYTLSAEQGNVSAQCNLAHCYQFGFGVKESYVEAVKWYEKAAQQNDDYAKCKLSIFYRDGLGVKKSRKKEFELLLEAAENGYPEAQFIIGQYYQDGDGYPKESYSQAVKWFNKAAMQNYGDACFMLASFYEQGLGVEKSLDKALKYYLDASKYGLDSIHTDIEAKIKEVSDTISNEKSQKALQEKKAKEEAKKAEKAKKEIENKKLEERKAKDNAEANYEKACELEDEGKEAEALKYYQLSADAGYAEAEYVVGFCYQDGKFGLKQSYDKAFKWFTKSHEHGYGDATFLLGRYYEFGYGVRVNPKKAFKYYKLSASRGIARGHNKVGICYQQGVGCFKNLRKAFHYFKLAAKNGADIGKTNMAWCLLQGNGVKANPHRAIEIFRDGLRNGTEEYFINECKYGLAYAMIYDYDYTVKDWKTRQNQQVECIKFLTEAAKHGHEKSKKLLYEEFGRSV